ncbi:MAG: helix-turn-helix domain-containing protein, partial [Pseudomonadota bacterium]
KRLGVTQHTLRELINRDLGYRNFSEFVNFYRIDAVKEAFSAPDNRHKSILEIAMENGFNSLSPFNKAFKKQVGVSPKEFRKELDQT